MFLPSIYELNVETCLCMTDSAVNVRIIISRIQKTKFQCCGYGFDMTFFNVIESMIMIINIQFKSYNE